MVRRIIWEPVDKIDGFEWFTNFEVSNTGSVRNKKTGMKLFQQRTSTGYKRVTLSQNGRSKSIFVHDLVARAFFDGVDEYYVVYFLDGDGFNTDIDNLCLRYDPDAKRSRYGGVRCVNTGEKFDSVTECAKAMSIPQSAIYRCLKDENRSYKGLKFRKIR